MLINIYSVYYVLFLNIFQKEVIKELIYVDNMCMFLSNCIFWSIVMNIFQDKELLWSGGEFVYIVII